MMGACFHTDDVRCSNCSNPAESYRQSPFEQGLKNYNPNAMLRALGEVLKNGPCDVPGCFVCEPKRREAWP
jgi:hypothetical protein